MVSMAILMQRVCLFDGVQLSGERVIEMPVPAFMEISHKVSEYVTKYINDKSSKTREVSAAYFK